jgi:hypothetical protein
MALPETPVSPSYGEKMLSIPRWVWFLLLIVLATLPQFVSMTIPNIPEDSSADLYRELMTLPEGSTVIVQTDWTKSTQGESRGQFDALLRILMRKNIKFAFMSVADPQAPEVARNALKELNAERVKGGEREYKRWEDFVSLGYFPGAEGKGKEIGESIRDAFKASKDKDPQNVERPVFESPVMKDINGVGDLSAFIVLTGTKSIVIALERLQDKVKMLGLVTGVMGPETVNYYTSNQLKGLSVGLKGVYDMETMMEFGANLPDSSGKVRYHMKKYDEVIPNWSGKTNLDRGTRYYLTLHFTIGLMIAAVIIGNVGVLLTRKKGNA